MCVQKNDIELYVGKLRVWAVSWVMGDPQVTMVFRFKSLSSMTWDLDDLGVPPWLQRPPYIFPACRERCFSPADAVKSGFNLSRLYGFAQSRLPGSEPWMQQLWVLQTSCHQANPVDGFFHMFPCITGMIIRYLKQFRPFPSKTLSCLVFFWIIIRHEWLASLSCLMPQHSFDPAPREVRWQAATSSRRPPPAARESWWHSRGAKRQPGCDQKRTRSCWWSQTAMRGDSGSTTDDSAVTVWQMFPVYALFQPGSRPSFSSDFPVNNGDFLLPGLMGTTGIAVAKPSCTLNSLCPGLPYRWAGTDCVDVGLPRKWSMCAQVLAVAKMRTWWTWSTNIHHWFLGRPVFGVTHVECSQLSLWEW